MSSFFEMVDIHTLSVDPRIQRAEGFDQNRVKRMSTSFDPQAIGTLTISQRPDLSRVIVDGMHRWELLKLLKHLSVHAEVFTGLTLKQEANLFLLKNDGRMPTAISKFKVSVIRGDESSIEIDRIVQENGWQVYQGVHKGCLTAVATIERIYFTAGGTKSKSKYPQILDEVLKIVTEAWGHDRTATNNAILEGIAQILSRYGDAVDRKRLTSVLSNKSPTALVRDANVVKDAQGGRAPAALAGNVVSNYNKGKRSNLLPSWKWTR